MKKRILALILATTLALSLAACSTSKPAASSAAPAASTGDAAPAEDAALDFPTKNISWIVAADAGAPLDIPTRALIENMDIDTNVIVENISGASNTIGTLETANRPADGYTLLTSSSSAMLLQPLMVELAYDPADFRIISLVRPISTYALVVGAKSPYNSAEEIMDLMKSGERFTYTVSNAGAASHLSVVDTLQQLNVETGVFVPYNGGAEVTAALLNQEVDFAVLDTPAQLLSAAKGDMKVLMIMGNEPDPLSPDTPYIGQFGITGMESYFSLQCIAIRRDTPEPIVDFLKEKINTAIAAEPFQTFLKESGSGALEAPDEAALEARMTQAREVYSTLLEKLDMIQK